MLYGKTVLIGVTGGIAAYKACEIVSRLKKLSADVIVIMTKNATEFVRPLTFESLSGNEVVTDIFNREKEWEIEHISYAKRADAFIIVPATANIVGKLSGGIADDMLTTTFMATKAPRIVCPAMNTAMYEDAAFTANLAKLKENGVIIVEPECGRLACGETGKGKLADVDTIFNILLDTLMPLRDYADKTVLITAGATRENIDNVRFISNNSSGKMGIEIARAAINRGAKVILVTGSISVDLPKGVYKTVNVLSTEDMYNAVIDNLKEADYVIKAAAPADYTVKPYDSKIKSEKLTLELTKTTDIAKEVGRIKGSKKLIIFSAETEDLIANAKSKLKSKNADMVVANDVTMAGAGFNVDTNIVSIITSDGKVHSYDLMKKSEVAQIILNYAAKL